MSGVTQIYLCAVIGKVGENNADVDETCEDTGTETSDRRWSNLGNLLHVSVPHESRNLREKVYYDILQIR